MDTILRGIVTYAFLWLVFRIIGKRALNEATTFDLVLLLIISETVQNALTDQDHSMTGGFLLIVTLLGTDVVISLLSYRFRFFDRLINGAPMVLIEHGRPFQDRLDRVRVSIEDILEAAREAHGLERLDQVKYAVLERNGAISVIPEGKA